MTCPRCGNSSFSDVVESGRYLLYSSKYSDGGVAWWWRPNSAGYTNDIEKAGVYGRGEAYKTAESCHWDAIPIPIEDAQSLVARKIIDFGDSDNSPRFKEMVDRSKSLVKSEVPS